MPLFLVDKGIVRVSLGEMELRKVEAVLGWLWEC